MTDEIDEFEKLVDSNIQYFEHNGKQIPFVLASDLRISGKYGKDRVRKMFKSKELRKKALIVGSKSGEVIAMYVKYYSRGESLTRRILEAKFPPKFRVRNTSKLGTILHYLSNYGFNYTWKGDVLEIIPNEDFIHNYGLEF